MTGPLRDFALALGLVVYAVKKRLQTGSCVPACVPGMGRVGGLAAAGDRTADPGPWRERRGDPRAEPFVEVLAASPLAPDVVVSASTATGFERARRILEGHHEVVRFPLDFTWMEARFLDGVRPELWCWRSWSCGRRFWRRVPTGGFRVRVNGRLSERSYRGTAGGGRLRGGCSGGWPG